MSLATLLSTAARDRTTLRRYHAADESDLDDQFAGRNVTVESRSLPREGPPPFVVIRDADGFRAAVSDETLRSFLSPAVTPPWRADEADREYRVLYDLLDDTVFAGLDRQQLLGATREIEDRAYRVGAGHLHVGFQCRAAFATLESLYRELAAETDLNVHVYVVDEWLDDPLPDITVHVEPTPGVGRYWFLAFDGGPDPTQQCALVAEQHGDTYEGVWSYDPLVVEQVFDALAGDGPAE
jgi:DICT domain-containing protein